MADFNTLHKGLDDRRCCYQLRIEPITAEGFRPCAVWSLMIVGATGFQIWSA